jgi:hypothetical protein
MEMTLYVRSKDVVNTSNKYNEHFGWLQKCLLFFRFVVTCFIYVQCKVAHYCSYRSAVYIATLFAETRHDHLSPVIGAVWEVYL